MNSRYATDLLPFTYMIKLGGGPLPDAFRLSHALFGGRKCRNISILYAPGKRSGISNVELFICHPKSPFRGEKNAVLSISIKNGRIDPPRMTDS